MKIDFSKFEKIHSSVHVYHNFMSDENIKLNIKLSNLKEDFKILQFSDIHTNWLADESYDYLKQYFTFKLNPSKNVILEGFAFVHVQAGNSWMLHDDSQDKNKFYEKGNMLYAGVLYLNDFDGGTVVYPDINCSYKAKKGDLLIHDSRERHYVEEVKSDSRHTITFYIWEPNAS